MHEEDFYTESLFKKDEFKCVFISSEPVKSAVKKTWLDTAKADASARCRNHFQGPVSEGELKDLISWAKENGISQIVTMRQDVGPINDQLYKLDGINIIFEDREEDLRFRPLTKAGFFGFWKKIEPILKEPLQ